MENAILMASGMGTRMRPLTETTPKPLISVNGMPMIETIIDGLNLRGVNKIVVVVGYLGEQFSYLTQKYENVSIIRNEVFETVNNISSVYAARNTLLEGDCFICEADLFVSDNNVFLSELPFSSYFGKYIEGYSNDWVFDLDEEGIITRVGKCGKDSFNMTGVALFKECDAKVLYNAITEEYGKSGYENLFWDDIVNMHIDEFKLRVHEIIPDSIVEIDTVEELYEVRRKLQK